jgi:hypothetical protein
MVHVVLRHVLKIIRAIGTIENAKFAILDVKLVTLVIAYHASLDLCTLAIPNFVFRGTLVAETT